ncbi:MAG: hypothetical protein HXY50_04935 [Ignavibacteriaceae bacterium]|nr:hypothetical protein [Ignavibacteriaceae bacterium]
MIFNSRKSPRLKEWDYTTPHWYFVTVCTNNHLHFFGEIINEKVNLNQLGKEAMYLWNEIPSHYKNVELDEFVIMPNHIHGIIILNDVGSRHASTKDKINNKEGGTCSAPTLSYIVGSYKSAVTKWANLNRYSNFRWQRSYYDRIIRNEKELYFIRNYIKLNTFKWDLEKTISENLNI